MKENNKSFSELINSLYFIAIILFSFICILVVVVNLTKKEDSIMLLYKITYQKKVDGNIETNTIWAGSQSECGSIRKNVRQKYGYIPNSVQTSKINVPTRKNDLINWLNTSKIR